ncbi:hypothetical protein QN277_023927 [Acacia crassicarpa]|uniref:Uncharacterized protein n=1 Tax=Acacia crassicarpa TaxID=499986 RepID=A0AAE1K6Q9_9FABA|nr:hypothetical protein QN277_023927 [Acacia crassicarpa]
MANHTTSKYHMQGKCKKTKKASSLLYFWPHLASSSVLSISLQAVFELGVFDVIAGAGETQVFQQRRSLP